jgi:hypothetical protein
VRGPDVNAYTVIDEKDRRFRQAVKRVVADVLDRIAGDIECGIDPVMAIHHAAHMIRNEEST